MDEHFQLGNICNNTFLRKSFADRSRIFSPQLSNLLFCCWKQTIAMYEAERGENLSSEKVTMSLQTLQPQNKLTPDNTLFLSLSVH